MNRLRRTAEVKAMWLGSWRRGEDVRSVHSPEPPLCVIRGLDLEVLEEHRGTRSRAAL